MSADKCCDSGKGSGRALFQIHAINDNDEIVFEQKVVAEGEKDALYESGLKEKLKSLKLDRSDVHVLVTEIGPVPAKEKPKAVKIIGELGKLLTGKN